MFERELEVAINAAKEAGKILISLFGEVTHIVKKGEIDLVTEADIRSEKKILEIIVKNFPSDNILAEETGNNNKGSGNRVWIVDPLDGTTNFAHGFPFFAISIALEIENKVVMGVVHVPYLKEIFHAIQGQGAFLNNKPIHVSHTRKLGEALLATGFPYDIHKRSEGVLALFRKMILIAQGVRRAGAAAIDLCYVAAGRLDGFWEEFLKPWDTAAGALIVEEAGGKLSTYDRQPYNPYEKTILASNPFIFDAMLEIVEQRAF